MAYALLNLGEWAAYRKERSGEGGDRGGPPHNAWRRTAALVGPLLAFLAAGCFTDPINHPPTVTIDPLDTPPLRQQPVMFHAHASDQDGDTVHLKWAYVSHACDPNPPGGTWDVPNDETSYMVTSDRTNGPFCVWVMATDSHNATGNDHKGTDPQDQMPNVAIKIVSPDPAAITIAGTFYSLYSTIEVSPQASDPEGDSLTPPQLVLDPAPGSAAVLKPCGPPNGSDQCFVADVNGDYTVSLTVADSFGKPGTAMKTITVLRDQPPCIGPTTPDFVMSPMVEVTLPPPGNPTNPTNPMPDPLPSFTIKTVIDDGAPWPPGPMGGAQFRWYVSTDGGEFQFFNNDYPKLPLASTGLYKAGDVVKVRVEVSDHNPMNDEMLAECAETDDTCQAAPGCLQRVTWSVDFR